MKKLYAKLNDGTVTLFSNPLVADGKKIYNPTDQQLLKAGYKNYEPGTLDTDKAELSNYSAVYTEDAFTIYQTYEYTLNANKAMNVYTGYAQNMMDNVAKGRNYDSIASACSYYNSTNEKFANEASTCIRYRDEVWLTCYKLLDDVMAGKLEIPSKEDFLALLPKFSWDMYEVKEEDIVEEVPVEGSTEISESNGEETADNNEEEATEETVNSVDENNVDESAGDSETEESPENIVEGTSGEVETDNVEEPVEE